MEIKLLPITKLELNTGQIPEVPKNPRFIKDHRFEKLVQSLKDDPEMMQLRECIVYPVGKTYVVICGNMRLRAAKEIGLTEMPCKVLPEETTAPKLRAYAVKDNVSYGSDDWDLLANEWNDEELEAWGVETPQMSSEFNNLSEQDLDLSEEFDPIGSATDLHKIVFIFDTELDAEQWMDSNFNDVKYKKFGGGQGKIWQVNLSKNYGK